MQNIFTSITEITVQKTVLGWPM